MVLVGSMFTAFPPEARWRLIRTMEAPCALDQATSLHFGGHDKAILAKYRVGVWWVDLRRQRWATLDPHTETKPNFPDQYFVVGNPGRKFDFDSRKLIRNPLGNKPAPGRSKLVWSAGATRIYAVPNVQRDLDGFSVAFARDSKTIPTHGQLLTEYFMHFDRLVGDPDRGPFVVYVANNRSSFTAATFSPGRRRVVVFANEIFDAGPRGFIGMFGPRNGLGYLRSTDLVCADARGRTRWTRSQWHEYSGDLPYHGSPKWIGRDVRTDTEILSGRDGRVLAHWSVPTGMSIVGWQGDVCWMTPAAPTNKLVAWRLTYPSRAD